jgi:hypothetical protein
MNRRELNDMELTCCLFEVFFMFFKRLYMHVLVNCWSKYMIARHDGSAPTSQSKLMFHARSLFCQLYIAVNVSRRNPHHSINSRTIKGPTARCNVRSQANGYSGAEITVARAGDTTQDSGEAGWHGL